MQEARSGPSDPPRDLSFWQLFLAICAVLFARKSLKDYMAKRTAGSAPDLRGSKIY